MFQLRQLLSYLASCHTGRRRLIFGAKLEAWRHKIFQIFHLLQSDMVLGIVNPFLMPSQVRKVACFQCLSCYRLTLTSGQQSFFRLLNPDWSIQISGAPALCKVDEVEQNVVICQWGADQLFIIY